MRMLFETCACEELNKLELYVHAAGGKRFKFEDNPSFFTLSGCSTTVHLLDHRHFHVLGVVVIGQIKVLGHGKNLLPDSGNCDYIPPQTEGDHQNGPQVYGWFLRCTACDIAGKGSHRPRRWQYNRTAF